MLWLFICTAIADFFKVSAPARLRLRYVVLRAGCKWLRGEEEEGSDGDGVERNRSNSKGKMGRGWCGYDEVELLAAVAGEGEARQVVLLTIIEKQQQSNYRTSYQIQPH